MLICEFIKLIPEVRRKKGIGIIFSAILQVLLNMAGLTVLIPIIILVFDPDKLALYPLFADHRSLILVAIVCFISLKNILNVWLSNIQIRYINSLYKYYSQTLFENYYCQGLLFVKNRHSDDLAYNINAVSYLFTHGVLSLTLSVIAEAGLILCIWCGIFWFSPIIAFCIVASFLPFSLIYFYFVRKKLKTYGEKEDNAKRHIMTLVGDTFRGYPDVKLNDAYRWFQKRFDTNVSEISNSREKITKAFHIPQGIIECYVVVGMILFVVIAGYNSEAKVALGILAVAILRILPSLRSLITMVIQWKNNAFTLDIIKDIHLQSNEIEDKELTIHFKRQIIIDNVSFSYLGNDKHILKNFTLHINKGECIGIKGISGVGKTTLFNMLLGFYKPTQGKILVDNIPLDESTCSTWQKLIAYVPQDIFIMDATLAENIAFGAEEINSERMMEVIEKSGLKKLVSSLPYGLETRIGQDGCFLSGGERQRVGIARALYKKAEIFLFDEITSSLDPKTEKDIMDTIYKLSEKLNNLTVVIISHKESALYLCNRILKINKNFYDTKVSLNRKKRIHQNY